MLKELFLPLNINLILMNKFKKFLIALRFYKTSYCPKLARLVTQAHPP
jgi:hypothetical protein